jgi:nitrogen-specific signal transduction histidine kinase
MTADSTIALARRNAELSARVEQLTNQLAQKEALTQLAAGTVHDLRNVFNVALIAAEALLQTLTTPDDRELAEAIFTASQHGTQLAQDLLTFARSDKATQTQCSELIPRLERMIERIACKRFAWHIELSPSVDTLSVERPQLEAALINLVVNARDAMPKGGSLQMSVKNLPEDAPVPAGLVPGSYVQFALTDTGHGMSTEVLARATEAFFTTKESRGGTGLGLAMAHAFSTRAGGALLLESQPGRGTHVRLILPRLSGPSAGAQRSQSNGQLDKIMERIRSDDMKTALEGWRDACPAEGLPLPVAVEAQLLPHAAHSLALQVVPGNQPRALKVLRVGEQLASMLERYPLPDLAVEGPVMVGTLAAAYRRALLSRAPSYEFASYALDEVPSVFERLILPAACDGKNVSHLFGIIRMSGALDPEQEGVYQDD